MIFDPSVGRKRVAVVAVLMLAASIVMPARKAAAENFNLLDFLRRVTNSHPKPRHNSVAAGWKKLSAHELACIDKELRKQGTSAKSLRRKGVSVTARRVAKLRLDCRKQIADAAASVPPPRPSPRISGTSGNPPAPGSATSAAGATAAVVSAGGAAATVVAADDGNKPAKVTGPAESDGAAEAAAKRAADAAAAAEAKRAAAAAAAAKAKLALFEVEDMALGAKVTTDDLRSGAFQCNASEQFEGLTWCQHSRRERRGRRYRSTLVSMLLTGDQRAAYVNRVSSPVTFNGKAGIEAAVKKLAREFGQKPKVLHIPDKEGQPEALIATWGSVQIEPLDPDSIATLAAGESPRKGLLVDFLGNFQRSAKADLPVYRLAGGAGYVWSASVDRKGRGHERALIFDAERAMPPPVGTVSATPPMAGQPVATPQRDVAAEAAAADRAAAEKADAAQAAAAQAAAEKAAADRAAAEKVEAEKAAAARAASEKAATDKLAAETQAAQRLAAERAAEQATLEQAAAEKAAAERAAQEKAASDKAAADAAQAAAERAAEEQKAASERAAQEKAAAEEIAAARAALEKLAAEKEALEKAAAEKIAAAEQAAAEKIKAAEEAAAAKAAAVRAAAEKAAAERLAAEKAEAEKAAAEKFAAEREAAQKAAEETIAAEREAAEKAAAERLAQEKAAAEKALREEAAAKRLALAKQATAGETAAERAAAAGPRTEENPAKFRNLYVGMTSEQFAGAVKTLKLDVKMQLSSYQSGDETENHLLLETMRRGSTKPVMYADVRLETPVTDAFASTYGLKVLDKDADYTIYSGLNPPKLPKFTVRRLVFYQGFFDAAGINAEQFARLLREKYRLVGSVFREGSEKEQCDQCMVGLLRTGESLVLRFGTDEQWSLEVEKASDEFSQLFRTPKL